jgi:alkylation response protein AidB-like acyl-CoA dehydrogenase
MLTQEHKGAGFLFEAARPRSAFTPEDLSSEQRLVAATAREFVSRQVRPRIEELENHDWALARDLVRQAGELGLLGMELPPALGGLGLDKVTASLVAREMAAGASFSVTYTVQTGIGLLPIAYFGTPDQKRKYLPGLASGEKVGAYSLTEPGSGSDALGAHTTARLAPDGTHYLLNGTKQWTTNAGFADLFIVFAKIDGQDFSAFLVERGFPGVEIGPEERKMGLHGSSTAQVILNDARVPVENVLHFPGQGHQVAFGALNLGRFSLAVGSLGAAIFLLGDAARYARERRQFGRPIASFRLIQQKLAGMATRIYALESTVFRLAGLLDEALRGLDLSADIRSTAPAALGEYAIECSIAKVLGTEVLRDVVDEAVQIHGGNGFMHGFDAERTYRDCRIFRIFEGTNEINRLLIPDQLLRRARRGENAATEMMRAAPPALRASPLPAKVPFAAERGRLESARSLFWIVLGLAVERNGPELDEEQEVLALAGDLAIEILSMDSVLARATAAVDSRAPDVAAVHADLARLAVAASSRRAADRVRSAVAYLLPNVQRGPLLDAAQRLDADPIDEITLGRDVAARVLAAEGWPLEE